MSVSAAASRACRFVIGVPSRIAESASLRCPVGLGERVHGRDPLAGLAVQDPLLDLFGYLGWRSGTKVRRTLPGSLR
jgi:hypothetical protein